jgi:hypothetical protein
MINYLLGFDPSFKTMGVAIKHLKTGKLTLYSGTFQQCLNFVNKNCVLFESLAVVENAGMISTVFKVWPMVKGEVDKYADSLAKHHLLKIKETTCSTKKPNISDVQSQFSIAMKYAQYVGMQKAACDQLIQSLESCKVEVLQVSPAKRTNMKTVRKKAGKGTVNLEAVSLPTKLNANEFYQLTKYEGSSNEHSRDAAILIYDQTAESIYKKLKRPNVLNGSTDNSESIFTPDGEFYKDDDLEDIIKGDVNIFN